MDIKFKYYNQQQNWLFPPSIEEMIPEDHPVRIVNGVIEQLNLNLLIKEYNKEAFSAIQNLSIDLIQSNRTWWELSDYELDELSLIQDGITPAAKRAEQILMAYGNPPNAHLIKKFTPEYLNDLFFNKNTFNYNLQISPNPANSVVNVNFTLPEWTRNAKMKLIDQYYQIGLELMSREIIQGEAMIQLNVSSLNSGVYIVNLIVNGETVAGDQLLVIH